MADRPLPDILFVVIDSLRFDALGGETVGAEILREKFNRGFAFSEVRVAAPYTIASINAIFTSNYPHKNGVNGWYKTSPRSLNRGQESWVEELELRGYHCSAFYETQTRGYAPPFGFSDYQLKTSPQEWDFTRIQRQRGPRFVYLHFDHLHDARIAQTVFTKNDYGLALDTQISVVTEQINRLGFSSPIMVILGDHGIRCTDDQPQHAEITGELLTDVTLRVPLVFIWEGQVPAGNDAGSISSVDIGPTLLELATGEVWSVNTDGKSLAHLLLGGQAVSLNPPRDSRILSITGAGKSSAWGPSKWAITDYPWKLVLERGAKGLQAVGLFNLTRDPYETTNRVFSEPDISREMSLAANRLFESLPQSKRLPMSRQVIRWSHPLVRLAVGRRNLRYEVRVRRVTLSYLAKRLRHQYLMQGLSGIVKNSVFRARKN